MLNRYMCFLLFFETGKCENPIIRFIDHTIMIQIGYLEQWPVLEEECNDTLVEAAEALKATTLRLPVTSGAHVSGKQNSCWISSYLILNS